MNRRIDNAANIQRSNERFFSRDSLVPLGAEPALASHLVTARTLYSHHGIYVGNGRVIHYAGTSHELRRGPVEEVSLEHFAHGHGIRVRHDRPRFDRREVLARARSRLGECNYRILTNNCEHFCEWCLSGASRSSQVERFLSGARRFACALLGTLGLAAGTPSFADSAGEHAARVEARTLSYHIQHDRPDFVIDSARGLAGCRRTVVPAVGSGPADGQWTSKAKSSYRTHRPMRWCAGTAKRSQRSFRSSFQISPP